MLFYCHSPYYTYIYTHLDTHTPPHPLSPSLCLFFCVISSVKMRNYHSRVENSNIKILVGVKKEGWMIRTTSPIIFSQNQNIYIEVHIFTYLVIWMVLKCIALKEPTILK